MAAEQKTTSLQKVALPPKQKRYEIVAKGYITAKVCTYKVDLHNYMYDVSCHLKTF